MDNKSAELHSADYNQMETETESESSAIQNTLITAVFIIPLHHRLVSGCTICNVRVA